jgi:hypothetical protein
VATRYLKENDQMKKHHPPRWVVRPDHSMVGTQDTMSRRDGELIGDILQDHSRTAT